MQPPEFLAAAPQTVTQWYVWRHAFNGSTYDEQLGSSTDFVTAPTSWATRADGATTERYLPTAVTPPVWSGPVSNLAAAHPTFRMLASVSPYGRQVGYVSFNLYEVDPLGGPYSTTNAAEVDRGLLERSYDGVHYYVFTTTSSKNVRIVGSTYVYGYSAKLVRNTWFRWFYPAETPPEVEAKVLGYAMEQDFPHWTAHARKVAAVKQALKTHEGYLKDPLEVLRRLGVHLVADGLFACRIIAHDPALAALVEPVDRGVEDELLPPEAGEVAARAARHVDDADRETRVREERARGGAG